MKPPRVRFSVVLLYVILAVVACSCATRHLSWLNDSGMPGSDTNSVGSSEFWGSVETGAKAINHSVNVTPSAPLVDLGITLGVALAAGASGWIARHFNLCGVRDRKPPS
jgi:hypothetical protein